MAAYGWVIYDIRKGGVHILNDTGNQVDLVVQYARLNGSEDPENWGLNVQIIPGPDARDYQNTSVVFYFGSEDSRSKMQCKIENKWFNKERDVLCHGSTPGLRDFNLQLLDHQANSKSKLRTYVQSMTVPGDTLWRAKPIYTDQLLDNDLMIPDSPGEGLVAPDVWKQTISDSPGQGNLHFVQKILQGHDAFEVRFSSSGSKAMQPATLKEGIADAVSTFDKRFNAVYRPQPPFEFEEHIRLSISLLSNLMGGIGYFHGTSKVDTSSAPEYAEVEEKFWEKAALARSRTVVADRGPYQLFSSVPSRPFFPRGFLWDEGFHLQIILDWDMDLALEILSSWFALMDENGWIAREQILGSEARSKVPLEFQTQYPHYANPPTLFLVVQEFFARLNGTTPYKGAPSLYLSDTMVGRVFLDTIYIKMKKHYNWFRRTQSGNLTSYQSSGSRFEHGYRWRGRTPQHILTSGLDDYPRAQPPSPEELHLDALSWVGSMAMVLKTISDFLAKQEDKAMFSQHASEVIRSIDGIHWFEPDQAYCDTTVIESGQVEWVCHKGYISLMPFLVGLMDPHHNHLKPILDLIRNPEELWSPFGIRSLSRKDQYYGTQENYWRSPIWININYMVLRRLLVSSPASVPPIYQISQQSY